jgi:hypothetical protein
MTFNPLPPILGARKKCRGAKHTHDAQTLPSVIPAEAGIQGGTGVATARRTGVQHTGPTLRGRKERIGGHPQTPGSVPLHRLARVRRGASQCALVVSASR